MRYITHDADDMARQVVPQDFSFLSEGTRDVVRAIEKILRAMYDIADGKPIWLGKMTFTSAGTISGVRQWIVEKGLVLLDGLIFEIAPIIASGSSTLIAAQTTYVQLSSENIEPSPLYHENGERDVYVHKNAVGLGIAVSGDVPENTYKLSDFAQVRKVVSEQIVRVQ